MPKISLDRITPGMVLTRPVTGGNGMVLLAEKTELSEKWIERLQAMGVEDVWVEGEAEPTVPVEEALAALEERFEGFLSSPSMRTIKKVMRIHIERLYA